MNRTLIKGVVPLLALWSVPAGAEWKPVDSLPAYEEVMKAVREGEDYTRFLDAEKRLISTPGDAYWEERWKFLKTVWRAEESAPDKKAVDGFASACVDAGWLSPEKKNEFSNAVLCLGNELIIDKSPFQIPLKKFRVIRDVPYASCGAYHPKLDVFLPEQKSAEAMPCAVFIHCAFFGFPASGFFVS